MSVPPPLFAATPVNASVEYSCLRDGTHRHQKAGREHCEDLWRDFAQHADEHFLSEFPIHLHERWFEMYLTVALMRAGLNVRCPKPGPDVLLELGSKRIWIEAVCATAGIAGNPDSVQAPPPPSPGEKHVATRVPVNEMVLRFRNSIEVKQKKLQQYLDTQRVDKRDVLVIALNVRAVHGAWADMSDRMMRALYGVGDLVLTLSRETGAIVGSDHAQITSIAKKSTGSQVGMQPFIDGSMPHISAVIGSFADVVNQQPILGNDFALFPNLTATTPWTSGAIQLGEEWTFTEGENSWDGKRTLYQPPEQKRSD